MKITLKYFSILLSFLLLLLSFNSKSQKVNDSLIIGIWIPQSQSNDTVFFKRNISSEDYQNLDSLKQKEYRTKIYTNLINNNDFFIDAWDNEASYEEKLKDILNRNLLNWEGKDLFNPLIVSSFNGQPYYRFNKNEELIVSQNCGWCGTPPISYCEYKGKWSKQKNGTHDLSYPFWGGTITETWEINKLSKNKMSIIRIKSRAKYDNKKSDQ